MSTENDQTLSDEDVLSVEEDMHPDEVIAEQTPEPGQIEVIDDIDHEEEEAQPVLKRDAALDEIAANARAEREATEAGEEHSAELDEEGNPITEPEPEPQPEPEPTPEPELYTANIDGVEMQVTKEKVIEAGIRTLQKEVSADQRLEAAARKEQELAQRQAQQEQQLAQRQAQLEQQQAEARERAHEKAQGIINEIVSGDDNKAVDMLADALAVSAQPQTPAQSPIDEDEIVSRAAEQVSRNNERLNAINQFNSEFTDIASNKELYDRTDRVATELFKENPNRPPIDIMREAGESTREWLKSSGLVSVQQQQTQETDTGFEAKRNQKRTTETVKPASTRSQTAREPARKTRSDVVNDMRKSRGQPVP